MQHAPEQLAAIAPLLDPGEDVWAVFPARPRTLVATGRRLFLVAPGEVRQLALDELARVRRERERLVVIEPWRGPAIGVEVDPRDERGLQALTVLGLLVATGNRGLAAPERVPETGPAVVAPRPSGGRTRRATRAKRVSRVRAGARAG